MNSLGVLIKRNVKLFFKDKGLFFVSLITPLILLVLFITFLGGVYKSVFTEILAGFSVSDRVISGLVGGQLLSSLLAVCCVTVAFCSNMLSVQDKVSGVRNDFLVSPVKKSTLAFSYYLSSLFSTLIICVVATAVGFIYLACVGWYLGFVDCLLIFVDVFILTMFGTLLSSIVNCFLHSQAQISAVGSIVSSLYGFVCGAYMPISNFSSGVQSVIMFLPGTYGTSLLRNHAMSGALDEMAKAGVSPEALAGIKDSVDCNLYFFGANVNIGVMYGVLIGTVLLLMGAYILINALDIKKGSRKAKEKKSKV